MSDDMQQDDTPRHEVIDLAERFIEGVLSDEESERLERLVCDDAEARRLYVTYMNQHASLRWHRGQPADADDESMLMRLATDAGTRGPRAHTARASLHRAGWRNVAMYALAAAALLAVGAWAGFGMMAIMSADTPAAIATLAETNRCRWDSGTLPTEAGADLRAGRLRLTEGLATIRFRSGAKVVLEGPADIELVDAMRCVLHAGVLVADVPEPAHGFVIDTPNGRLIDHGTSFGVSVDTAGDTVLQVFDGEVEVAHGKTGERRRALTGANLRVDATGVAEDAPVSEPSRSDDTPPNPQLAASWTSVTTAAGRGRDTFVQDFNKPSDYKTTPGVLLCKHSRNDGFNRKVYLAFDLAPLRGRSIADAEFIINLTPSGHGFAANLPDCTFTVYGLTDESRDTWSPDALAWDSAPAHATGPTFIDTDNAVPLGTFVAEQGIQSGARTVRGQALVDFLRDDTNGVATLIIVRDTRDTNGGSLVHGFASSTHPTVAPPTLRIVTE